MRRSLKHGFTLIELIIYIAIVGIFLISVFSIAFILSDSRARFMGRSYVYGNASRLLNTIDYLVRNADGFVTTDSGKKCVFSDKLWLYYATSSVAHLPPGCMGGYASGAISVEQYTFDGGYTESSVTDYMDAAIDNNYLYVVGRSSNAGYIQKLNLSSLEFDRSFGTNGTVEVAGYFANGIAIDSQYLYVVFGNSDQYTNDERIEKRRLDTGALCTAAQCGTEFGSGGAVTAANASSNYRIAIDDTYMYVTGFFYNAITEYQHAIVQKRRLDTGALDNGFGSSGVLTMYSFGTLTHARDITLDASNNHLFVTGQSGISPIRFIQKRLMSTGAACTAANCGTEFGTNGALTVTGAQGRYDGITSDSTHIYLAGYNGNDYIIEKRLKTTGAGDSSFGSDGIITGASTTAAGRDIAVSDNYIYFIADDATTDVDWLIEKRRASDGVLEASFGTVGQIRSKTSTYIAYALSLDADYLYVVGRDGGGPSAYIERRDRSGGALASRSSVRLICYHNYPNVGKAANCATDPPNSGILMLDLTNPFTTFIGAGDFSVTTTTAESRQAFEIRLNVGPKGSGLGFSPPTITPSSTTAMRVTQ